ncbi:MAG TPA: hypothetical protein VHB25_15830 [Gemmatimonadaceae bacterium]|nr:hypothetical protein [Gemmatimonadaceae bacterium]
MKIIQALLVGAALSSAPMLAGAQRGIPGVPGMNGMRGERTINFKRDPGVAIPTIVQPINLMIEHRQEIALTDSQFMRVIRIKRALDSLNSPLMRKLDSVQRLFRGGGPLFGDPSPARRDSLAEARGLVVETVGAIRDNIDPAEQRAFGLLTGTQRATAERIVADEEHRIQEADRKKKGGGGREPDFP